MKSFTVTSLIFALFSLIVTTTATPVGKLNTNENEDWIKNEDDDLLDADILQKLASTKRYSTADIRVNCLLQFSLAVNLTMFFTAIYKIEICVHQIIGLDQVIRIHLN